MKDSNSVKKWSYERTFDLSYFVVLMKILRGITLLGGPAMVCYGLITGEATYCVLGCIILFLIW